MVQGIGNLVEWLFYLPFGGKLSELALTGKVLSSEQHKRLTEALKKDPKLNRDITAEGERRAIVREVYALVVSAGKAARVDAFNGNYGLLRGLAASFLALISVAIALAKTPIIIGALVVLFVLALQRMHRYSCHYTTELFTQYLLLDRAA